MGYGYFFLMGIQNLPNDLTSNSNQSSSNELAFYDTEAFIQELSYDINDLYHNWKLHDLKDVPWFIDSLGKNEYGSAGPLSCGNAKDVISPAMKKICQKYPDLVFNLYHCYWDCMNMTVYTFKNGELLLETEHEAIYKHGEIIVRNKFTIEEMEIPGNITCYINRKYSGDCDLL